jgi:DNA-binding MarR family transcriptional regulator
MSVLLVVAGSDEPVDFGGVAKELGFSRPALSRACDTLIIHGFLSRVRTECDRRRCDISLTAEGRKFVGSMATA